MLHSQLVWVQQCKAAVQDLQKVVKSSKAHIDRCSQVFGAALGAVLPFEQAAYKGSFTVPQAQQFSALYASLLSVIQLAVIELAVQQIQVMVLVHALLSLPSRPVMCTICTSAQMLCLPSSLVKVLSRTACGRLAGNYPHTCQLHKDMSHMHCCGKLSGPCPACLCCKQCRCKQLAACRPSHHNLPD